MIQNGRDVLNSRAAILGSIEDFTEDYTSFEEYIGDQNNQNPFTDEATPTISKRRRSKVGHFLKKSIQRVLHIKLNQKNPQIFHPVIASASDIPDYETVIPARHVTTNMAISPRLIQLANNFRSGIKNRPRDEMYLLSSASAGTSVNSLFEDGHVSLEGTGATTADSNAHIF